MDHYFIRFSACEKYLQDDLQRGYSFNSYHFDASAEGLLVDTGHILDEDEYDLDELIDEHNIRQNSNGDYGFALSGLCGYGPFETVEEAEEEARYSSYGTFTVCGIYAGRSAGLDSDCNELFVPASLVKVFDTQEAVLENAK